MSARARGSARVERKPTDARAATPRRGGDGAPLDAAMRAMTSSRSTFAAPMRAMQNAKTPARRRGGACATRARLDAGVGAFGSKAGMTQVFTDDGLCVPVTVIAVRDGNVVTQVREKYRANAGWPSGGRRARARETRRTIRPPAREGWTTGSMDGRGARDASTRAARSRWANDRVVLSSIARAREGLGWGGRGARRTDASRARGEALGRGYRRDARARARRTDAFGRGVERRNAKERIRD